MKYHYVFLWRSLFLLLYFLYSNWSRVQERKYRTSSMSAAVLQGKLSCAKKGIAFCKNQLCSTAYRGNEEQTRSTLKNSNFELLRMSHSLKVPYMSRILSRFSLRGGRGRLFEGGCLFQILSHRRGTNLKQGAYLKLGANSSIYGKWLILTMISRKEWRELYFIMFSQQWR